MSEPMPTGKCNFCHEPVNVLGPLGAETLFCSPGCEAQFVTREWQRAGRSLLKRDGPGLKEKEP